MKFNNEDIKTYYKDCHNAYRDAWGLDQNMQLNLGLWYKDTKNLSEALFNLNVEMGQLAEIDNTKVVLDAGCGVGGTAIHLAKNYGCKVIGITLSENQCRLANENATIENVSHLVEFQVMDYMQTSFENQSFDVIIGMESIVYAQPKKAFIEEAFRLLKDGGKLVLAENLQAKEKLSTNEHISLYTNSFNGCKVESLDTENNYINNLNTSGFIHIKCIDKTKEITPSIKRLRRIYYAAKLYNLYHRLIGKPFNETQEANTKMCYHLWSSLKNGLWGYGLIHAVKPKLNA